MAIELGRTVIGVHVEGMFAQSGDVGPEEPAAECQDEAVIGEGLSSARRFHAHGHPGHIDAGDFPFDAMDSHGSEDVVQGNPD